MFARHQRLVMTEDLDALEGKEPARIRRRAERGVKAALEPEQHREIVNLSIFMP
jgi:hypothetical protein